MEEITVRPCSYFYNEIKTGALIYELVAAWNCAEIYDGSAPYRFYTTKNERPDDVVGEYCL